MLREALQLRSHRLAPPDSERLHIVVRDIPSGAIGSVIVPTKSLR